jgi:hypothetical protein
MQNGQGEEWNNVLIYITEKIRLFVLHETDEELIPGGNPLLLYQFTYQKRPRTTALYNHKLNTEYYIAHLSNKCTRLCTYEG